MAWLPGLSHAQAIGSSAAPATISVPVTASSSGAFNTFRKLFGDTVPYVSTASNVDQQMDVKGDSVRSDTANRATSDTSLIRDLFEQDNTWGTGRRILRLWPGLGFYPVHASHYPDSVGRDRWPRRRAESSARIWPFSGLCIGDGSDIRFGGCSGRAGRYDVIGLFA
jgi:hypothetical protein